MLETTFIEKSLAKATCYSCGALLKDADFISVSEAPVVTVVHAICNKCHATSMVTVTPMGVGTMPLITDFTGNEFEKFMEMKSITYDEILELHRKLKDKPVWRLMQRKDKFLEKEQEISGKKENSQQ